MAAGRYGRPWLAALYSTQPTREPRWYVVRAARDRLLEVRALPAGSDLKRIFVAAMLERIDTGWQPVVALSSSLVVPIGAWSESKQPTLASQLATERHTWLIRQPDPAGDPQYQGFFV